MGDAIKPRGIEGRALSGREVTGREIGMRAVTAGGKPGTSTPAVTVTYKRNVILVMRAG